MILNEMHIKTFCDNIIHTLKEKESDIESLKEEIFEHECYIEELEEQNEKLEEENKFIENNKLELINVVKKEREEYINNTNEILYKALNEPINMKFNLARYIFEQLREYNFEGEIFELYVQMLLDLCRKIYSERNKIDEHFKNGQELFLFMYAYSLNVNYQKIDNNEKDLCKNIFFDDINNEDIGIAQFSMKSLAYIHFKENDYENSLNYFLLLRNTGYNFDTEDKEVLELLADYLNIKINNNQNISNEIFDASGKFHRDIGDEFNVNKDIEVYITDDGIRYHKRNCICLSQARAIKKVSLKNIRDNYGYTACNVCFQKEKQELLGDD